MSLTLGLNFGHDSSACVLDDGEILSYINQERFDRIKHSCSLSAKTIERALIEAKISYQDLDSVAITSSQGIELLIKDSSSIKIDILNKPANAMPSSRLLKYLQYDERLQSNAPIPWITSMWRELFPDYEKYLFGQISKVMDYYYLHSARRLSTISNTALWDHFPINISALRAERDSQFFSIKFTYEGCEKPGIFVDHHLCHANSAFFTSGFKSSLIVTHDGSGEAFGYSEGGVYLGLDGVVYPVFPHSLIAGKIYHLVGANLGLGRLGAPGKLMGLAAYGRPIFYDDRFVGNHTELIKNHQCTSLFKAWWDHCMQVSMKLGYKGHSSLGSKNSILSPLSIDIAASTQKLFEETLLLFVGSLKQYFKRYYGPPTTSNLCLSGGAALNCPTNKLLVEAFADDNLFIDPACDDGGLSMGAAFFAQSLNNNQLNTYKNLSYDGILGLSLNPFIGPKHIIDEHAFAEYIKSFDAPASILDLVKIDNPIQFIAEKLNENSVVCWFEGRSELGPRALGHRSFLASATDANNLNRCNNAKNRELWRPFAPLILEEYYEDYFSINQAINRYMLVNSDVKSSLLPAVTHADNTARAQSVSRSSGSIYDLLVCYHRLSGVPVLINTSFNGPGEPIIETPWDALRFFLTSQNDDPSYLYIGGLIYRRSSLFR
jgi:carbamoyltransferase